LVFVWIDIEFCILSKIILNFVLSLKLEFISLLQQNYGVAF
jgi:hypothetical protein